MRNKARINIKTYSIQSPTRKKEKMMPKWIEDLIRGDRRLNVKYLMSKEYCRRSSSIQFIDGDKSGDRWVKFGYVVNSKKYGRYWVKYEDGRYECNCPFFKGNPLCSHIIGVCQKTDIWPDRKKQLKDRTEIWKD